MVRNEERVVRGGGVGVGVLLLVVMVIDSDGGSGKFRGCVRTEH